MKIGIIGGGNMGLALFKGMTKSGEYDERDFIISDINEKTLENIKKNFDPDVTNVNAYLVEHSDIIVLAVVPNMIETVLTEIDRTLSSDHIIISFAAGVEIARLTSYLTDKSLKIVRAMPNIPMSVGKGMTSVAFNDNCTDEDKDTVFKIFNSCGIVKEQEERLFNLMTALTGSGPALIFVFLEALADGAVKCGLSRDDAYLAAAQLMNGSSNLFLESKTHPGILKDNVCSPGGTAIEAIATLEKNSFRYAVIEAIEKCAEKAGKM
ncbi:MAG TPA: pyrroline-5-carboxylate reductase [Clostridiaceae bacterium]|nr:pyrroline-5-carboxylate reductase [Clostridiaceae bacterium]